MNTINKKEPQGIEQGVKLDFLCSLTLSSTPLSIEENDVTKWLNMYLFLSF